MNYLQREYATKFLALQADALAQLEALLATVNSEVATAQLVKMQHDIVNLQNKFLRLVYLTGEVTGE